MLAERYLRRRYEEGYQQGLKLGRAKFKAAFRQWNEHRLEAKCRGEIFTEPIPNVDDKQTGESKSRYCPSCGQPINSS